MRILVSLALIALPCFASSLMDAVKNDDIAGVAALLKKHANVNEQDDDGATALDWSVLRNNVDIASLLLKAAANPNLVNEQGVGPLYLAIMNGSPAMVKLLLANNANADLAREDGETPLMAATRLGQIDVVTMLLDRHANVNARQKKFNQTALMWAAGHPDEVRLLLAHGADAQAKTKAWEVTATIYTPGTLTLGKTGIPWNNDGAYVSPQGGQNALFFAVQKHDLESARLLLDAGIDVNGPTADGTTPLLAALYKFDPLDKEFVAGTGAPGPAGASSRFGADIAMAQLFLDRGAKVSVADAAGYTPLHGAVLAVANLTTSPLKDRSAYGSGHATAPPPSPGSCAMGGEKSAKGVADSLAMVRRLLELGADPNRQTLYPTAGPVGDVRLNPASPGSSAFHISAEADCLDLVKALADRGANPNLVRKDGHTPLSLAVLSRDLPVVKEMVRRGGNLSARYSPTDHFADPVKPISLTRGNQSIMHIAAGAAAPEIIEYLYSQGARLDLKNSFDETPLDFADHQERFRLARTKEGNEDHPERVIVRETATTDMIKKLMNQPSNRASASKTPF